jgi:hypothetical protein
LLFPALCVSTAMPPKPKTRTKDQCADRMAKMPRRTRTRRQSRAAPIAAERKVNREYRLARRAKIVNIFRPEVSGGDDDAPPLF